MPSTGPVIELSGSSSGGGGSLDNDDAVSIADDYAELIATGSNAFQSADARAFHMEAGEISAASPAQIGRVVDGVTITAAMVEKNQTLLDAIGAYCRSNGISISVGAHLADSAQDDWTYQWLEPAAQADLPITAVENDDEVDGSVADTPASFAALAQNEVAIVREIASDFTDVSVGQWEGGSSQQAKSDWWTAYDAAARAAGLPTISYVVADTSWNAPWVTSQSDWTSWLQALSASAEANGMGLTVLVDGVNTDASSFQWSAQSEQHAAMLAQIPNISVTSLRLQSWQEAYPDALLPVNDPGTLVNDAAEINALFTFYQSDSITATDAPALQAVPQVIVQQSQPAAISVVFSLSATDVANQERAAVVLIDEAGDLTASQSGYGSVTGNGTKQLVLVGSSADLAAEIQTLRVDETAAGPDDLLIETFGINGLLSETHTQILALPAGASASATDAVAFSPTLSDGWTSAQGNLADGTILSLHYDWNQSDNGAEVGQYQLTKHVSVHDPLAEPGVLSDNGTVLEPDASPELGSSESLPFTLASWNGSAFDPARLVSTITVASTDVSFSRSSGKLLTLTDTLLPSVSVGSSSGQTQTTVDPLAAGGSQVTQYNTGDNPNWVAGDEFASVTTTYSVGGKMLEQTFVGGAADPYYVLDNVYDPNTGKLWEQVLTGGTPNGFGNFVTGPEYVTQFNTGNNPNWDVTDWGSADHVTVTWQDYYAVAVSTSLPTGQPTDVAPTSPTLVTSSAGTNAASESPATSGSSDSVGAVSTPSSSTAKPSTTIIPAISDMKNPDGSAFLWTDVSANSTGSAQGGQYIGPNTSLHHTLITDTNDSFAMVATTPGAFILDEGTGENAISVSSGSNVISTYHGSKFITLGSGTDEVYVSLDGKSPVWDTVVNFGQGDDLGVWDYIPASCRFTWIGSAGTKGAEGLTLDVTDKTGVELGRVSFSGLSLQDVPSLSLTTGVSAGLPYLRIDHL